MYSLTVFSYKLYTCVLFFIYVYILCPLCVCVMLCHCKNVNIIQNQKVYIR